MAPRKMSVRHLHFQIQVRTARDIPRKRRYYNNTAYYYGLFVGFKALMTAVRYEHNNVTYNNDHLVYAGETLLLITHLGRARDNSAACGKYEGRKV